MNLKDFNPLGERVIVKVVEEEQVSSGGIILTQSIEKPKYMTGVVVKASNFIDKPVIKEGYKVVFNRLKSEIIDLDMKEYYMCAHGDVIAILHKQD